VVESIPQDASAYDKYRYLAYFLSEATDYDEKGTGGILSITPYGAIVNGRSICLGYATAYLYLCERADLWCSPVYGYSENGVHGWDLVKLEDGTYYVDVTWCDGLGLIGTDQWQSYFMLTEDVLLEDHGILSGGPATGTTIFG
jgi:transglutaminase/protease-like cytokinesis protein 3